MPTQGPGMPARSHALLASSLALLAALAMPAAAQPATVEHVPMEKDEATSILGREVLDPAGKPAGRIVDVLVDGLGQVRAAVVDFGGFLGIGQRRIAVAWLALHFVPADHAIILELSADQIAASREYKPASTSPVMIASPPPAPTPPPPKE
jgi:hypothetical protein